jgi:hypothetical protein
MPMTADRAAWPPLLPDGLDFIVEAEISRIPGRLADQAYHRQHVFSNGVIDIPEIHRVPAAVFLGVVPGQQEIRHTAGLAGILPGHSEQTAKGFKGPQIHPAQGSF